MAFSLRKFKLLMAENGVTTKALSKACGISQTAISQILNHGQQPKLITIGKLAKGLNVPAAALMTDD